MIGDRVLVLAEAERRAAALAREFGCTSTVVHGPENFDAVIADLRTYSLFSEGKVVLAIETEIFADRSAAGELLAEAMEALPWAGGELSGESREAAVRLLAALRLLDLDPSSSSPERLLAAVPDALLTEALRGAKRKTSPHGLPEARAALAPLLDAATRAGLRGWGEGGAALVADLLRDGLPGRHALVLAESRAAAGHSVVEALRKRGGLVEAGRLTLARGGGFAGLDRLAAELERETGVGIRRDALAELARRSLRSGGAGRASDGAIGDDSSIRFAAEYRKLSGLSGAGPIERSLVEEAVEDRGDEDVWKILDAVAEGNAREALARTRRFLAVADDIERARLSLFALVAAFARHMASLGALVSALGLPRGEANYARFKSAIAPRLQGEVPHLAKNPVAGVHPFRLHRAYLAAQRVPERDLERLPWRVLETERRLKGESADPDAALESLLVELSAGATAARAGSATISSGKPLARPRV